MKRVVVFLMLVLPGCLQDPAPPTEPEDALPPIGTSDQAVMNECTGYTIGIPWAPGENPGQVIAGWTDRAPMPTDSFVWLFDCERLRVGPFERPLQWLLEGHHAATPPQGCVDVSHSSIFTIHWAATSDEEVSAWLTNRTGMKFSSAAIRFDAVSDLERQVTLDVAGRTILQGEGRGDDMKGASRAGDHTGFYQHPDGGMAQLNLTLGLTLGSGPADAFLGEASPPLLAASARQPFPAQGGKLWEGDISWEISHHAATDCA